MRTVSLLAAALIACLGTVVKASAAPLDVDAYRPDFPRLMGANIGAKTYDQSNYQAALARYHVIVLGFYRGWRQNRGSPDPIGDAVRAIKLRNPSILIAQYGIFSEARRDTSDIAAKIDSTDWWLRDSRGAMVQWTDKYKAYEINITEWASPDERGRRYPQWLAERDFALFHRRPEFDIWYLDNSSSKPLARQADWDRSGRNSLNDDPRVATAHRLGHARGWEFIRNLQPGALLIGNSDDVSSPEYSGKLNGVFMEALIGKSWSIESWGGWDRVMQRYRLTMRHVAAPRLVGFGVLGKEDDYRLMRYGLASCLMDDGYFAYSSLDGQYSTAPWFDEFDADLGQATEPAQVSPWRDGVYRRMFERGMALVNPTKLAVRVEIPRGYQRLRGAQQPDVNSGAPVTQLTIGPKDGVILKLTLADQKTSSPFPR